MDNYERGMYYLRNTRIISSITGQIVGPLLLYLSIFVNLHSNNNCYDLSNICIFIERLKKVREQVLIIFNL